MIKGKFLIKAKEKDTITNKGIRAFIMERLLNSPLQKGAVLNIDDYTVEVQLEGEKEVVEKLFENLKKALTEKVGNPVINFSEFKEDRELEVPDLMRASQALTVEQLEKGINAQLETSKAVKETSQSVSVLPAILKALEELPGKLAEKLKNN